MKSVVASPTRIDGQQVAALCGINVRQVRHSFGRSGRVWLSHSPFHELISIVSSTYNEPRLMTPAPAATPEDDGEVKDERTAEGMNAATYCLVKAA